MLENETRASLRETRSLSKSVGEPTARGAEKECEGRRVRVGGRGSAAEGSAQAARVHRQLSCDAAQRRRDSAVGKLGTGRTHARKGQGTCG